MRQILALIAAIPMAYFGYMLAYLTREPEGIPLMVFAFMLAVTAVISFFSKTFSLILNYFFYAIGIIAFLAVISAQIF